MMLKTDLQIMCETILEDASIVNTFDVTKTTFINSFEYLSRDRVELQFSRRLKG